MKWHFFKERKFTYLAVTGTIVIILATGALFSYSAWFGRTPDNGEPGGENDTLTPEEEPGYVIQYIYSVCGHHQAQLYLTLPTTVFGDGPGEGGGADHEYLAPPGWHITELDDGQMLFTFVDDICQECSKHYYLGSHDGNIAIFRGIPPNGVLEENLGLEIKDTFREELETGVPYTSEEEKNQYLQSFTS